MPTTLRIVVYPVFAVVCLFVFFFILFPYDSIRSRVSGEMENFFGGQYAIKIGSLSPSSLTGGTLKDVELTPRIPGSGEIIKVSRINIELSLLPLLSGALQVHFDVAPSQGRASGEFSFKKAGNWDLDLKMDRFELGFFNLWTQKLGVNLSGRATGTTKLEIYPQDPLKNAGTIVLQIPEMSVGAMTLAGGLVKLPAIRLADPQAPASSLDLAINRGNFEIKSLQLSGGDIVLGMDGKIYSARQWNNYRFNLKGTLKFSDELVKQVPLLSAVEKQKSPDGSYPLILTGRIDKPSIRVGEFKLPL